MEFYTGLTGRDKQLSSFDFGSLDTAAYASGDILTSSAIQIPASRYVGMGGVIDTTNTLALPDLRLWFFGGSVTPASRNSPQAFSTTQMALLIGYFDIASGSWINGASGVAINTVTPNLPFVCQSTSKTIYMVPEIKSAETFHSSASITGQIVITRE